MNSSEVEGNSIRVDLALNSHKHDQEQNIFVFDTFYEFLGAELLHDCFSVRPKLLSYVGTSTSQILLAVYEVNFE